MFRALLGGARRHEGKCYYEAGTVVWTALLSFMLKDGSLRHLDVFRTAGPAARALWALSGQPASGRVPLVPCADTLRYWFSKVDPALTEALLDECLRWAVRSKLLDGERLRGCVVVAADGSGRDRGRAGRRFTLRASVVTRFSALPLATEEIGGWGTDGEKAASELAGLRRLSARVKARFPRLGICLAGDALYANEALYSLCESNGWHYVATFKEGACPAQFREALALMDADPGNSGAYSPEGLRGEVPDGTVRWAVGVEAARRLVNVVECSETGPMPYHGYFATDLPVGDARAASEIATWGRRRWNIESSFHTQKHGGYGLGHNFCDKEACNRNLHILMQIAFFLWEIFEKCLVRPNRPRWTKVTGRDIAEMIAGVLRTAEVTAPGPGWTYLRRPRPG